jgi:hypothetical protein
MPRFFFKAPTKNQVGFSFIAGLIFAMGAYAFISSILRSYNLEKFEVNTALPASLGFFLIGILFGNVVGRSADFQLNNLEEGRLIPLPS